MPKNHNSGDCPKCGTWRRSLHRDHVIPKFKGGSNDPDNIQYLCANCHEDKTREDFIGRKGYKHTEESKTKMRGRRISAETRAKTSATLMGHPVAAETIEKMRAASTGRVISDETRELHRRYVHTQEARNKISAARKGHVYPDDVRAKISHTLTGHPVSEETRARMSASCRAHIALTLEQKLEKAEVRLSRLKSQL